MVVIQYKRNLPSRSLGWSSSFWVLSKSKSLALGSGLLWLFCKTTEKLFSPQSEICFNLLTGRIEAVPFTIIVNKTFSHHVNHMILLLYVWLPLLLLLVNSGYTAEIDKGFL